MFVSDEWGDRFKKDTGRKGRKSYTKDAKKFISESSNECESAALFFVFLFCVFCVRKFCLQFLNFKQPAQTATPSAPEALPLLQMRSLAR